MKQKLKVWFAGMALMLSLSANNVVLADNSIAVRLDGEILSFDVQPQIINGRTMVPMRTIFEKLGAAVEWE